METVMKRIVSFSLFVSLVTSMALAWGQKGHDAIAAIAERHLTPAAQAAVDSLLEGRSLVYWANWLDNASHTREYAYSKTWHYKNVDKGVRYEEAPANPAGDAVTAIKGQMETLRDGMAPFEKSQTALKMLIHIVGDMHQPLHMGHATDLGANRITVDFFGREAKLHAVWDSRILESGHNWSYTEWADQLDRLTAAEAEAVAGGSLDDWAKETLAVASVVYDAFPEGKRISYNEVAEWEPVIEQQLLRGGLRLARVLNSLFDPALRSTAPYK